jgi:uncharacterized protein
MSKHPIVHVEIPSKDRNADAQFYHELFGWEMRQIPEMDYATFATGENEVGGGLNPVNENNPPGNIMVYINTDQLQETLQEVERLGGKVIAPPMDIPGVGMFAIFSDPTGNSLALLQPVMGS